MGNTLGGYLRKCQANRTKRKDSYIRLFDRRSAIRRFRKLLGRCSPHPSRRHPSSRQLASIGSPLSISIAMQKDQQYSSSPMSCTFGPLNLLSCKTRPRSCQLPSPLLCRSAMQCQYQCKCTRQICNRKIPASVLRTSLLRYLNCPLEGFSHC